MKKYSATIDSITINQAGEIKKTDELVVSVLGNDYPEAVKAALDIGQAYARSANNSDGKLGIFFRVINVHEMGTI